MGYNTSVIVLNDALGDIERNPAEFVKGLVSTIREMGLSRRDRPQEFPCGCHCNPAAVVEQHHADQVAIIAVGGNTAKVLATLYRGNENYTTPEGKLALLRDMAESFGYKLVRSDE